jgi:hypothetical protein
VAKGKKQRPAPEAEAAVRQKRIAAIFFRTEAGGEPVWEWLKSLSREDCKQIGTDIMTVEFGGRLACPCVVRSATDYMKSAPALAATGLPAFFFMSINGAAWCCYTALSRKRRKRRQRSLVSPPTTRANMSEG